MVENGFTCAEVDGVSLVSNAGSTAGHNSTLQSSHAADEAADMSEFSVSGIDPELARVDHLMDQWTLDLKRSVLVRFVIIHTAIVNKWLQVSRYVYFYLRFVEFLLYVYLTG